MKREQKHKDNVWLKVKFYIISLWFLFILLCLLTFNPLDKCGHVMNFGHMIVNNIFPLICCALVIVVFFLLSNLKYKLKGAVNPCYKIKSVKDENYEYLTFLTTYIIPLVCLNLDKVRYIIVLFIILLITGLIFVKMDLYMGNPTLALLGYRLYRIEIDSNVYQDDILVLSMDKLYPNDSIEWIEIDNKNWYVRRTNDES